jgi:hypothetical protein
MRNALILVFVLTSISSADEPKRSYPKTIDLNSQDDRQVVVDRETGQYLGHPTTCLLEDHQTMLCVYPKGHGRGGIVYKRSTDGGLSWSERLPTPDSWATSKEVPTLHRVIGPDGVKRIIMWSGLYPARLAVTGDDGSSWSELNPVGDWGGIVVMGFVEPLKSGKGHYMAMFHDDGRYFSKDGGLTWSFPELLYQSSAVHLCEPGCIRSPDGKTLAVLLRENARRKNSHVFFSDDEGQTWSTPRELPLSLTGDRHTGKYAADGRLFISFGCNSPLSNRASRPLEGDWVGWVGTWDDIRDKVRRQHVTLIDRIVTRLKSVPESGGTIFDNTMLFYLPNNGETHHSKGTEWPFIVLAGNNARLDMSRRYVRLPGYGKECHKTLGNWYTTILNAYGNSIDHYGALDVALAIDQKGPIEQFLG